MRSLELRVGEQRLRACSTARSACCAPARTRATPASCASRRSSRRISRSSVLPRAWSPYCEPGQRSNRSARPIALAEVLPELALARHEQHVAVRRRVELVAHAGFHARGSRARAARSRRPRCRSPRTRAVRTRCHVSLRSQSIAAAASDCAISSWQPSPVSRARSTPARRPSAPNTGPGVDADRHVLGHVREAVARRPWAARCRPTRRTRCRGSACRGTGRSCRSPRSCRTRSAG